MAGVVIALQAACDCGAVNEPSLQRLASAADLRVRRVAAAAADLIVTRGGQTAAFLLWRGATADAAARTSRAAGSFKSVFVLVPHDLAADPAILDAAARCAGRGEGMGSAARSVAKQPYRRQLSTATACLPCLPTQRGLRGGAGHLCLHAAGWRLCGAGAGAQRGAAPSRGRGGSLAAAGDAAAGGGGAVQPFVHMWVLGKSVRAARQSGWHLHPLPTASLPPLPVLQQTAAVESGEAVTQVLLGLPLPADAAEAMHHAAMLRMLGSLHEIRWAAWGGGDWAALQSPPAPTCMFRLHSSPRLPSSH